MTMTFREFMQLLRDNHWSLAQIRCDVPPSAALLDAIDEVGLDVWEMHVRRYEKMMAATVALSARME